MREVRTNPVRDVRLFEACLFEHDSVLTAQPGES